jgi:tetratricopeptide (TPR) repeat protein
MLILSVFLPLQSQDQDRETRLYTEIEGLINDGLYQEALDKIETYLQDFPAGLSAELLHYNKAELLIRIDRFADAAQALEGFMRSYPSSTRTDEAQFLLAGAYRLTDRLAEAESELGKLLSKRQLDESLRVAAMEKRAEIALQKGRPEDALRDLEEVVRRAPNPQRRLRCANVYYEIGNFKQAEKLYSQLLEENSLSGEDQRTVTLHLALSLYKRNRYRQVIELLQPLQEQYGNDDAVLMTLAWALYQEKRFQEAYDVVAGRPRDAEAALSASIREGMSLLLVHEYGAAVTSLERIVRENKPSPALAPAYRSLSQAYLALGDVAAGISALEKMAEVLSDDAQRFALWLEIGDVYQTKMSNTAGAIASYRKALAVDPRGKRSDELSFRIAKAQVEIGDLAGAVDTITHFLASFPESRFLEDVLLLQGRVYERAAEHGKALDQYRTVAQSNFSAARRREAYQAGLDLAMRLRRWDDAVNIGREYLQEFPEAGRSAQVQLDLAASYFQKEQFKDGINHYELALKAEEGDPRVCKVLLEIGWGYYKLGEFDKAETYFKQVVERHPQEPEVEEALYWLGWLSQVGSNLESANSYFTQLLRRFPQSSYGEISLWQVANNHLRRDETSAAINALSRIVDQFPDGQYTAIAGQKLVETYIKIGNYRAALERINVFVEADPSQQYTPAGMLAKGNSLAEAGNRKAALKTFQQLLERFPASDVADEAILNIGIIQYQLGNHIDAVAELRKVQEFFAESDKVPASAYYLGRSLMHLRRYEEAIAQFSICIDRGGEGTGSEVVQYLMGVCYEQMGDDAGAARAYRQYLARQTDPSEQPERRLEIAFLFARAGYLDEAAEQLSGIISAAQDPELVVKAQYALGEVLEAKGQLAEAALEFLKVTYVHSSSPLAAIVARFRAGELFERLGRFEEAINVYQKIAENHKGTRFGEAAAIRIEALRKNLDSQAKQENGTSEERKP